MSSQSNGRSNIYSVTQLNRFARMILESEIGLIWLSAEISNFVAASSGHWYFTLKDERAQVRAAMFRGANRRVTQRPKEGDKVLVRASVGLYEPRGDYQLVIEHLEPAGEGLLKQQFEQLKAKLMAEGLFAQEHKQALPTHVRRIGVITSATGAALHDILTVLKRRNPSIEVIVYPSQVQGDTAAAQLIGALATANRRAEVDVLILGRGGGSLEDLWCFNDEALARAIYDSPLPIVSAVGHEIDFTICDYVADLRAPTPSAAAELLSQHQDEMGQRLTTLQSKLQQAFRHLLRHCQHRSALATSRLQQYHPQQQLQQQSQRLDQWALQLHGAMQRSLNRASQRCDNQLLRLTRATPARRISLAAAEQRDLAQRLRHAINNQLKDARQRVHGGAQLLDTVSPLATLARGYSIAFDGSGNVVKSVQQVERGDTLVTKVADGEIHSQVTGQKAD
ncbi:exodeoxyribonuclease VII large subunit [Aestuariibacter halophilus]|uniref:Exodeoxyribonuclease 7 large subunit n=1 Tax=Fluctibacter halophilus TaxID=226011 RepID=A0ABS8G5L3_9ALTE|nr:exodeoxyribonuclease VII large subunit [Aestuariibacter halophilus]MCC2614964.1 exodeoxyribonuclease VII large subunit [Aestuariibacter halophilus]